MAEQQTQQGVIAAARAAAPVVAQPAQTVTQSVQPAPVAQPAPAQGFGAPAPQNGFAPQPVAQPEVVAPVAPVEPVATDNDRTRQQFEKLTDTNQRLAQTNELLRQELLTLQSNRTQSNQQFAPVQTVPAPQPGQQPSAMPKLTDYIEIDQRTGERFVNEAKFNAAVADIYQKASRAEEVVKNYVQTAEQREIARQESEAYQTYPSLNPTGGQFDQRLAQQTRAIIYDSMINPHEYGGRPLSFKQAADFITRGVVQPTPPVTAVPTPAVNSENQVQKEQAALAAQPVPQQVSQFVDADREFNKLVQGTRLGSDEAIAVRLLNATHRLQDVESETAGR